MSGYTACLDTFGMTRHTLDFNSLAVVDGVLVGLDDNGAFALDGLHDEGRAIAGSIETGWTDFQEFAGGQGIAGADFQKRLNAVYVSATGSGQMTVEIQSAEHSASVEVALSALADDVATPITSRAVVPRGMKARFWKIALRGQGVFTVHALRVDFDILGRPR